MEQKFYTDEKNVQVVVSLLKAYGINKVIASPGTTNLTFVACLQHDPFFKVYSAPEERSAAYMAVGMAEESGEPVVITCTGATASRNYLPALTEAFYRKLPVLAITATQSRAKIGQYVPQVIDRSSLPKDVATYSVHIPTVKDDEDFQYAVLKTNEAFHYLSKAGGGPVHINLETVYSKDFTVKHLPAIKKIEYLRAHDALPTIPDGRIAIYIGSHSLMNNDLTNAIDNFCERYGAVVFCDHTSNYKGKYRFQYPLLLSQDNWASEYAHNSLIIHIGGISGAYAQPVGNKRWRVNPDGIIRTVYGLPDAVFEMREIDFFNSYINKATVNRESYLEPIRNAYKEILALIPDNLPFSNIWVAQHLSKHIPENSVMHFGILNSLRSWNFFELPKSVDSYCNVGGFGIDGPLSTVIGGALAQPNRMHFIALGDLAFFYDINSLGNRHLPNNLRIIMVNNGRGTEFTNYNHPASSFGKDADIYMAAAGHYGHKSTDLVRHYAEDLGITYLTASSKDELLSNIDKFVDNTSKPILLEIFTESSLENEALRTIRNLKTGASSLIQNTIRKTIGPKGVQTIKKILGK